MNKKKITITDLIGSIRQLPKTLYILKKVDGRLLFVIVILSIVTGIFPIITLLISQELLNSLVEINDEIKYIFQILVLYIIVSFVSYLADEGLEYVQTMYQYKIQYRLQYMLMEKCTKLNLRDFESSTTYDTIEKISGEISYRPYQMFLSVTSVITAIVTMCSSVALILTWRPEMALLLFSVPVISLIYYLKVGQQEFDMMWNRANEERKLWYFNHLLTHDFSFKEIKTLGIAKYILSKYLDISRNFVKDNKYILNKKTVLDIFYGFVIQLISFVIIGFSVICAYAGEILVGNVISIIRAISLVQINSRTTMTGLCAIYSNSLYMNMLFQFMSENEQIDNVLKKKIPCISDIELRHVYFSYDNQHNVLNDISLHLKKGKRIAIVGPNGSGKSTLLKLLIGLYEPSKGEILVEDTLIDNIDMDYYYKKISVLFQDFVKYEFTLKENVGFGDFDHMEDHHRIIETLKEMKTDFLRNDLGQYELNMQLGNWFKEGRELSQGQWQKIALARACFKKADCYILDEPNAALDTVSEREVFEEFFRLTNDKLGIYISHRLNAAMMADEIIVMDQGRIVAIGKHEDLLRTCKVYRNLYEAENYGTE